MQKHKMLDSCTVSKLIYITLKNHVTMSIQSPPASKDVRQVIFLLVCRSPKIQNNLPEINAKGL